MNRAVIAGVCCALTIAATSQSFAQVNPVETAKDFVVATVNGVSIMESDISGFYNTLPPQYKQVPYAQIRNQLVERMVEQTLVADAARKAGLHEDPDVKQRILAIERSLLNEAYLSRIMKAELTEAKVRDAYQKSIALQPKREEVHARHILVKTKAEADAIVTQLKKGADFIKLAKEKSTGPSGKNGGDLGFFGAGQMVPPFSKAAFALEKGQITDTPVKTQFGYHVIKVVDRRVAGQANYEQASAKIRAGLQDKIFERIMTGLRAKAKIEIKGGGSTIQPIR
ncbi:MAG: peptidylprolyl isomerase [Alphaproteobacteria bacterium]|nr:peptidylprolyl isomerase [Alphaproteobacteria bacterium]